MMRSANLEGLKSPAIQTALGAALAGRPSALESWLCRYGAGAERRPNLNLAAALGVELAAVDPAVARSGAVGRLLARLAANDAAPDTPEVFLPTAAAFGWAAWIGAGRDREAAWAALGALAADERAPVRLGVREALRGLAGRPGGADELVRAASGWLAWEERELRYGAAGVAGEVLGDRQVVTAIDDVPALLSYVSSLIEEAAGAPRAAERSDGRRRLLLSLPGACAAIAAYLRGGDRGPAWLEAACIEARHPDVRAALSSAILALRKIATAPGPAVVQRLRQALEGSAKPPRDPTRRRPGTDRGRDSRRMK